MAETILRGVSALIGLLMIIMGLNWIIDPAGAAGQLGMPLLDGAGRSTQIGDLTAFFLGIGIMTLLGTWLRNVTWVQAAALLLGGTAIFRTLAWALHGADFVADAVIVEVVSTIVLLSAAAKFSQPSKVVVGES